MLVRRSDDETSNLLEDPAPPRLAGVRPFPCNQLPMRAQQRVRRGDRGNFPQHRTAHTVRPCSQPSALVVAEAQSPGPKLAPQKPVLFNQVRQRLPLPAIQPAGKHEQDHLERRGVDHESKRISRVGLNASAGKWNTTVTVIVVIGEHAKLRLRRAPATHDYIAVRLGDMIQRDVSLSRIPTLICTSAVLWASTVTVRRHDSRLNVPAFAPRPLSPR